MTHQHLSDDRLIALCLDDGTLASEQHHLAGCRACDERRAQLARLLTDVSDVVAAQADAAFTPERLARQRARILQRVEQEVRHARVISFPAGHGQATIMRPRPGMRWIAGAAAAGLIIGVAAGQLAHRFPGGRMPMTQASAVLDNSTDMQFAAGPLSDEEFLSQIEVAVEGTAGTVLRPLDDLTPRVWEAAAQ